MFLRDEMGQLFRRYGHDMEASKLSAYSFKRTSKKWARRSGESDSAIKHFSPLAELGESFFRYMEGDDQEPNDATRNRRIDPIRKIWGYRSASSNSHPVRL
jgi:hypothetical protein